VGTLWGGKLSVSAVRRSICLTLTSFLHPLSPYRTTWTWYIRPCGRSSTRRIQVWAKSMDFADKAISIEHIPRAYVSPHFLNAGKSPNPCYLLTNFALDDIN
jgi:hypothetical protein